MTIVNIVFVIENNISLCYSISKQIFLPLTVIIIVLPLFIVNQVGSSPFFRPKVWRDHNSLRESKLASEALYKVNGQGIR